MDRYFIGDYYISDGSKPITTKLKMPIEWFALEHTEDGKTLLFSRNVIDWELYDCKREITWENSYAKKHLDQLFKEMFSAEEKEAIIVGELGPLFFLSEIEIRKYLPTEKARKTVQMFVDNEENGELSISLEHNSYWLRSTQCFADDVPYVDSLGAILFGNSDGDEIGVRVAMWVDEKKARILTAKKGFNCWHHFWDLEEFED